MILAASSAVWRSVSTSKCRSGYGNLPSEFNRYLPSSSRWSAQARSDSHFCLVSTKVAVAYRSRAMRDFQEAQKFNKEHLLLLRPNSRSYIGNKIIVRCQVKSPNESKDRAQACWIFSSTREKASKRNCSSELFLPRCSPPEENRCWLGREMVVKKAVSSQPSNSVPYCCFASCGRPDDD